MTQDDRPTSGFETRAIHAGYEPDPMTGSVIPPIYATSTYKQDGVGGMRGGYEYSRSGNPTRAALEGNLAALEEGARGFAFASGLAAEDTLLRTICSPDDHVVIPDDAYGGTFRLIDKVLSRWGLSHSPAAVSDVEAVREAIIPGRTRAVWIETPTNPLLNIGDIEALAAVAHEAGALLVVDNTFASPYLQQPLTLGADVVVHSTTKYCGGHSDVVGGALVVGDLELAERLAFHHNAIGAVAGPFDSWLVLRGLKTLGVRMDRHCDNAERVVEFLTRHRAVSEVIYPGLPDHSGHEVATRQMKRYGGIVSFRVTGGEQHALDVCGRTQYFTLGESLGGVESLIEHPGRMTHASVAGTDLEVPPDLVRLSVGIETAEDLLADLDRALGVIHCVDFGSTFTKVILVEESTGELLGFASHRTTLPQRGQQVDVLDGLDACRAELAVAHPGSEHAEVLACSSAGGGLRIAVIGSEELVTAEAGRRVALSSGGRVVAVLGRESAEEAYRSLWEAARPDVLLLTGGTDGGDEDGLLLGARRIAKSGWLGPVVVAGNVAARAAAERLLQGLPVVLADNVVPRIGVLAPEQARRAIREVFLSHVIGGKRLSRHAEFAAMVRGATPDLVLTGVEVLAAQLPDGAVVVVDIGGATTDVHSVVPLDPEQGALSREVVASTPVSRTVEGDLGMRWSALGTWEAGMEAGLVGEELRGAAQRRCADPSYLPRTEEDLATDEQLATTAALVAVRRHVGISRVVAGPDGRVVERSGKDLRQVGLLVGSGGVLRHAADPSRVLKGLTGPSPEGWQLPEHPRIVVDHAGVLAAAGLLAESRPAAAAALARNLSVCARTRVS